MKCIMMGNRSDKFSDIATPYQNLSLVPLAVCTPGAPQFFSMNRPVQPQNPPAVGGSLPYRRPASLTGQPNMPLALNQPNGGPHFNQVPGNSPDQQHDHSYQNSNGLLCLEIFLI